MFINDVSQIWTIFDPPPPYVTHLYSRLYALLHHASPLPLFHYVTNECSIRKNWEKVRVSGTAVTIYIQLFNSGHILIPDLNSSINIYGYGEV